MREVEYGDGELPFEAAPDELDDAVMLVADTIEAVAAETLIPERLPKSAIPLFANYGKTLREGESFLQDIPRRPTPVRYSIQVRDQLAVRSQVDYEDILELAGEVRSADLDGLNFSLRLDDGSKIPGKFSAEQEDLIVGALREHASRRLRVRGRVEFAGPSGKVKRIVAVQDVSVLALGDILYDLSVRPIWETVAEVGASVPVEEWARVPEDLSKRLDGYLYGLEPKSGR